MKDLINRIIKLWEEIKEAGIFSSIWMALFIEKDGVVHIHCMNEYLERRKKQ